jgi:hypothetical protein
MADIEQSPDILDIQLREKIDAVFTEAKKRSPQVAEDIRLMNLLPAQDPVDPEPRSERYDIGAIRERQTPKILRMAIFAGRVASLSFFGLKRKRAK